MKTTNLATLRTTFSMAIIHATQNTRTCILIASRTSMGDEYNTNRELLAIMCVLVVRHGLDMLVFLLENLVSHALMTEPASIVVVTYKCIWFFFCSSSLSPFFCLLFGWFAWPVVRGIELRYLTHS